MPEASASSPTSWSITRPTSIPGFRRPGATRIHPSETTTSGATPTRPTRATRIIFRDTESSNWTWDPVARQYFWHRFYSHQPDLNFDNPAVQKEMLDIMAFWLDRGIDGFRVDAVPYLFEREGTNCENLPETHEFLKDMRQFVDARYPGTLAPGRGQPVAQRPPALLRQRRRVSHGLQLPADAPAVHGHPPRRPAADHRDHEPDARDPARPASGHCSCATTTS